MDTIKKNNTAILAEALGISPQEAKAFGDEVNQLVSRQGGSPASFVDIARTAGYLPAQKRSARTVAMHLLQGASQARPSLTETPPFRPAAALPTQKTTALPPVPLQPAGPARVELGTIEYVQPLYLTLIVRGERVNCMRDRWPFREQQPLAGMKVEVKYRPSTREVLEILQFTTPVGLTTRPDSPCGQGQTA